MCVLIPKTPWNIFRVIAISLNVLIRTWMPSNYVPAQRSLKTYISSPYLARLLATIAEPIVLEGQAAAMGIPFWGSPMGWLTIIGECVSWVHLIVQSEAIGILEDSFWMSVQAAACFHCFYYGTDPFFMYIISIPFLVYMTFMHQPRQIKRVL